MSHRQGWTASTQQSVWPVRGSQDTRDVHHVSCPDPPASGGAVYSWGAQLTRLKSTIVLVTDLQAGDCNPVSALLQGARVLHGEVGPPPCPWHPLDWTGVLWAGRWRMGVGRWAGLRLPGGGFQCFATPLPLDPQGLALDELSHRRPPTNFRNHLPPGSCRPDPLRLSGSAAETS